MVGAFAGCPFASGVPSCRGRPMLLMCRCLIERQQNIPDNLSRHSHLDLGSAIGQARFRMVSLPA